MRLNKFALSLVGLALVVLMVPSVFANGPPPPSPGKVTGGGQIAVSDEVGASFGFNIVFQEGDSAPKGELQYVDHSDNMKVHSHDMISLRVWDQKTKAEFEGYCTIDHEEECTFYVYVEDNGEPGKNDAFEITLSTGYSAGGTILNGNIQIHKKP